MATARLKIKLNRNAIYTDYINITIFLSFITLCLAQTFNAPSLIYFLIDVPIVIMITKKLRTLLKVICWNYILMITLTLFVIFITLIVGIIVNEVPFGNAIYGIYKYFRGFLFFYCTLAFSDKKSIGKTISMIKIVFILNLFLTFFQFFILGINQDLLGGIFGMVVGVNQYTNLFFVIISVFCIEKILNHDSEKKELHLIYIVCGIMLMVSALAEIKYFFAEFIILFLIGYFLLPKNRKSVLAIFMIVLCVLGCYKILIQNFPEFSNLVTQLKIGGFTKLADLQRHYSTDYDIGRAVIFSYSNRYLLPKSINQIFGMGIGNVTSSNIVNNSFWIKNQDTHYDQFYTAYLYNEQGIVGFVLYCLIYIELLVLGIRALMNINTKKYGVMLILLVVGCVMIFAYNMAIYSQLTFIIYWALAILVKKCLILN